MNREYLETARLLIQVAPLVFVDDQFGLKGGTAINLFLRDMPRLSVDLDLVFTDTLSDGRKRLPESTLLLETRQIACEHGDSRFMCPRLGVTARRN